MKKLEICAMENINGGASWACIHAMADWASAGHTLNKTTYGTTEYNWAMLEFSATTIEMNDSCNPQ